MLTGTLEVRQLIWGIARGNLMPTEREENAAVVRYKVSCSAPIFVLPLYGWSVARSVPRTVGPTEKRCSCRWWGLRARKGRPKAIKWLIRYLVRASGGQQHDPGDGQESHDDHCADHCERLRSSGPKPTVIVHLPILPHGAS